MTDPLTYAVVAAAEHVPADLLLRGASAIEVTQGWSTAAASQLCSATSAPEYQHRVDAIAKAWESNPKLPGVAVAAAMRSAVAAVEALRADNLVSLVWTGPPSTAIGMRSTRSVVGTIVADATESLVLVSFASYKVPDLLAGLAAAISRGVEVSMILETSDDSGGDLSFDAAKEFAELKGKAKFYRWPLEARRAFFAGSARLHAKCIIADRSKAFVTSANLTGAGINDNIELGVLIEAGPLPAKLHDHLRLLVEAGTLELSP